MVVQIGKRNLQEKLKNQSFKRIISFIDFNFDGK